MAMAWQLRRLMVKRYGRNLHADQAGEWTRDFFEPHGLHRLRAPVQSDTQEGVTMPRGSSGTRRRENRMYGLKGGWGNMAVLRRVRP